MGPDYQEENKEINCECHKKQKKVYKASPVVKSTKIGRNKKCPCGSNLKYKKCCFIKN